jgi:hypothetical protein
VAICKDTPIRRCRGNQLGNLRNEGRPCAARTGPTRAGDKRVTLLRWGLFASEHGLVEKDPSRGEAHISSNHTAVPWMFEAVIVLEL